MTDHLTRPIVGIENRSAQEVFDIMVDRIRLANPSPVQHVAPQCCMCGKQNLSTIEGDGGSECELENGLWVCSAECWDRAAEPAQDVINLVIAAREFWDEKNDLSEEANALDRALEAFPSRVPYENEPETDR